MTTRSVVILDLLDSLRITDLDESVVRGCIGVLSDAEVEALGTVVENNRGVTRSILSYLLCWMDSQDFISHLDEIIFLVDEGMIASEQAHETTREMSLSREVKNIAIVTDRIIRNVPSTVRLSMGEDKLVALLKTVFLFPTEVSEAPLRKVQEWSVEDIDKSLEGILPHLTIATSEDAHQARVSRRGKGFRKIYVESVLFAPFPDSVSFYPDELIDSLCELRENDPNSFAAIQRLFYKDRTVGYARSLLQLVPMAPHINPFAWDLAIRSAEYHMNIPLSRDLTLMSDGVQKQFLALATVVDALPQTIAPYEVPVGAYYGDKYGDEGSESAIWRFEDERVAGLIKDNADRAHEIAAFVADRRSLSYDALTMFLQSQRTALVHGSL